MFTNEQLKLLDSELHSSRVKNRTKGNVTLSYLEGFDVLDTANSIFGFGNWSYKISKLEQISQEYNQNENVVLCHKAIVEVKVFNQTHDKYITREDVGYGTGISKSLADANENASKEAVTDAIKRAMRSFGNQFGNSLYDKSKSTKVIQTNDDSVNIPKVVNQVPQQTQTQTYNNIYQSGEYDSLYKIGLDVIENSGYLIVTGDDIFAKKDSIKACGFRWDGKSKSWYKQLEQGAA
ncbi:Rad52/Rad22 family DNA repair protein [Aliarcobacter cryaerophilus]|uniref:DNA repair protein Rad52 n=1 Tax=Aliarcobacter cryaerophilus TaxID=28198 RepID=A0A2S9SQ58_9BACT|nr:Rad52/Rad22 family DNA repair protein [Aliarcobacter cryaerophilus]PRM88649.1 DNA repair protein Rad52 [Aliarcobacter cryaerophilus]